MNLKTLQIFLKFDLICFMQKSQVEFISREKIISQQKPEKTFQKKERILRKID